MLNKVILQGRIGQDLELKQTQSGVSVVTFNIACDRNFSKDKVTDWFSIVAWRNTAEFIAKYFKKGDSILIAGELQTRSFEDKQGNKRTVTEVVASEAFFCGTKNESEGKNTPTTSNANTEENRGTYMPSAYGGQTQVEEVYVDDDIPF